MFYRSFGLRANKMHSYGLYNWSVKKERIRGIPDLFQIMVQYYFKAVSSSVWNFVQISLNCNQIAS